jgi:hypothetical protein
MREQWVSAGGDQTPRDQDGGAYVDETIARGFRPDQTAAPAATFSRQHAFPGVLLSAIGAEEPADLTSGNANVARGHVDVRADVAAQLAHEGDAELADLVVALALGVEVGAPFAAAHVDCQRRSVVMTCRSEHRTRRLTSGESILVDLLETQELQDREVHRRVKAKSALVGAEAGVELHSVTPVDLHLTFVIFPEDPKLDDSLWDGCHLEGFAVLRVLVEEGGVFEAVRQLYTVTVRHTISPKKTDGNVQ